MHGFFSGFYVLFHFFTGVKSLKYMPGHFGGACILMAEMDAPAHIFYCLNRQESYPLEWEVPVLHSLFNVFNFSLVGSSCHSETKLGT